MFSFDRSMGGYQYKLWAQSANNTHPTHFCFHRKMYPQVWVRANQSGTRRVRGASSIDIIYMHLNVSQFKSIPIYLNLPQLISNSMNKNNEGQIYILLLEIKIHLLHTLESGHLAIAIKVAWYDLYNLILSQSTSTRFWLGINHWLSLCTNPLGDICQWLCKSGHSQTCFASHTFNTEYYCTIICMHILVYIYKDYTSLEKFKMYCRLDMKQNGHLPCLMADVKWLCKKRPPPQYFSFNTRNT